MAPMAEITCGRPCGFNWSVYGVFRNCVNFVRSLNLVLTFDLLISPLGQDGTRGHISPQIFGEWM